MRSVSRAFTHPKDGEHSEGERRGAGVPQTEGIRVLLGGGGSGVRRVDHVKSLGRRNVILKRKKMKCLNSFEVVPTNKENVCAKDHRELSKTQNSPALTLLCHWFILSS